MPHYVLRLKMPNGYKIPAHNHPTTENVTVISGNFHIGMGEKFDEKKGIELTAGGYGEAPAKMRQALHLLSKYTVKDRSRLRMSIRPMTRVSSRDTVHKRKPLPVDCHHGEEPIREISQQRRPGSTPGLFSWA